MRNISHSKKMKSVVVVSVLLASAAAGQDSTLRIAKVDGTVTLDSFEQQGLARIDGFIQRSPSDGMPATEQTEVYVAYDDTRLYVVFSAHDSEPKRIRARMTPRESISGDDFVTVMLDTFRDRRRAYVFRANPFGVQWDALWNEGQGFDSSFDTVWTSDGRLTEDGYQVLFAIPFKSLRFSLASRQSWGAIFSRSIPRGQAEDSHWPHVSSRIQGWLNQAGELIGIENVSPSRNAQIIPYGSFRSFNAIDTTGGREPRYVTDWADAASGVDVKFVVKDALVLDATLNPDFSQVESDQPQVTVNQRFEVFFPERRPFFLENADFFRTPLNLMFTRRVRDPSMGLRSSGKLGPYSVGAMVIDDRSPGKLVAESDALRGTRAKYAVFRLNRDLGAQSTLGAIFVGREHGETFNRVSGVDGRVQLDDHWTSSFQAVVSGSRTTDGADLSGHALDLNVSRQGRQLNYFGSFTALGKDFRADTGFVPRTDIRETSHFLSYFFRPESTLISWGPELFFRRNWDSSGLPLDYIMEGSLEWHFDGQTGFEVNYRKASEGLRPQDFSTLGEVQRFDVGFWNVEYQTAFSDAFNVNGDFTWGEQIHLAPVAGREPSGADWRGSNLSVSLRPFTRLRIDNTYIYTRLTAPVRSEKILGDHVFRTRWNWQFSREASLRLIVQYERTSTNSALTSLPERENWNGDVLFTYRVNPWTAVYVGYNGNLQNLRLESEPSGNRLVRTSGLENDAAQVFVKVSYLLRF